MSASVPDLQFLQLLHGSRWCPCFFCLCAL